MEILFLISACGFSVILAGLSLDKAEISVLDESYGTATVKVLQTKPRSIDLDFNVLTDAKDVQVWHF